MRDHEGRRRRAGDAVAARAGRRQDRRDVRVELADDVRRHVDGRRRRRRRSRRSTAAVAIERTAQAAGGRQGHHDQEVRARRLMTAVPLCERRAVPSKNYEIENENDCERLPSEGDASQVDSLGAYTPLGDLLGSVVLGSTGPSARIPRREPRIEQSSGESTPRIDYRRFVACAGRPGSRRKPHNDPRDRRRPRAR